MRDTADWRMNRCSNPQLQQTEALESCGAEITALRTKLDQLTAELEAAKNPTVTTVSDDDVSVSQPPRK